MPVQQSNTEKIQLPHILLDTCIIQYAASKETGPMFQQYLTELDSRGFPLAISEISVYELLQGTSATKEAELLQWLNSFNARYLVDSNVLITAAQLRTLYDMEKVPQEQIGDGDKVISSTSVLTDSLICTANVNDFPRPFFYEAERKQIIYNHKSTERMIMVFLLGADIDIINHRFANRPKK